MQARNPCQPTRWAMLNQACEIRTHFDRSVFVCHISAAPPHPTPCREWTKPDLRIRNTYEMEIHTRSLLPGGSHRLAFGSRRTDRRYSQPDQHTRARSLHAFAASDGQTAADRCAALAPVARTAGA